MLIEYGKKNLLKSGYIYIIDSLRYTSEANTLQINHMPIKFFLKRGLNKDLL